MDGGLQGWGGGASGCKGDGWEGRGEIGGSL